MKSRTLLALFTLCAAGLAPAQDLPPNPYLSLQNEMKQAIARIRTTTSIKDHEAAGLIIEAATEKPKLLK